MNPLAWLLLGPDGYTWEWWGPRRCPSCNRPFWRRRPHKSRFSGPYERGWHWVDCPGWPPCDHNHITAVIKDPGECPRCDWNKKLWDRT